MPAGISYEGKPSQWYPQGHVFLHLEWRYGYDEGMSRWWRYCLVWCLALALPVKGWAVAAMPCQMPNPLPEASQVSAPDTAMPPCHEAVHDTDGASSPIDTPQVQPGSMFKACSICMSGATVASLPAFVVSLPEPRWVSAGPIPFLVRAFVSHVPDGLDPPPRTLIA